ncbi:MAG: alpha/beta hydrolase [Hyphomonadaceae bacterium]|nr:alpha/beta hydrolase [Hyphomonadaceae bacterium]
MRRRTLIGGGLGVAVASTCAAPQRSLPQQKTFVLVHGAWHGGWCWDPVGDLLRARGAAVYAPTLRGLAERRGERTPVPDLSAHIEDVVAVFARHDLRGVTLVGHSYGGMVITGVADRLRERIAALVYLDAALPRDGETMVTQNRELSPEGAAEAIARLRGFAPDGVWMTPPPASLFGLPADLAAAVQPRLTPHPLPSWEEPIRLANGGGAGIPSTYVLCTAPVLAGTAFPGHAAWLRVTPGWRVIDVPTGHDAMLTEPGTVAEILHQAG